MSAMAAERVRTPLKGSPTPRIAPPLPARSDLKAFRETASGMGIELMPWQDTAARYLTAKGRDGHLYREVCIVVARQNGKTTLMKPLIIAALKAGKKVMHLAQIRELPREMFGVIADALADQPELFPQRRGRTIWPRYGSGQEEIRLANGGWYRIAAAGRGGGRGWATDLVIIDEIREMDSFEIIGAVEPTLMMSADPQMIYLSNAGTDDSVVLNSIRDRAGKDEALAYLEWSAQPERTADDMDGWAEANPAMGHYPSVMRSLEAGYRKHKLAGTLSIFETENLCRWVKTIRESLVDPAAWMLCQGELPKGARSKYAVSMAPDGSRAEMAEAWMGADGTVALRLVLRASGDPINTMTFGKDVAKLAGVSPVAYDPITDAEVVKGVRKSEPIAGGKFSNASSQFANLVAAGRLRWADADAVTDDLTWTSQKLDGGERGSYQAVRAKDDRPIPASLAAIRAVWLASGIQPTSPRVF